MKKTITLLLVILSTVVVSCNKDDENATNCTDAFIYGLNVTVRDAGTGELVDTTTTVTATDGDYSETLVKAGASSSYLGAGERPGNYIIRVSSSGYEPFVSDVITVTADECHVMARSVEVRLNRL
ncbi:hypothetical protein [Altibacter sp. HG106]|uniref:hypothetical protein n=1 Tax=Altibacter sp. HG106 TaxID=3023937 RepID=UPI0023509B41|nr:hypothetical protein [Altibacter sp. HG106]MDC7994889.1 hypothetical protein [Altibacter sp. HG106]